MLTASHMSLRHDFFCFSVLLLFGFTTAAAADFLALVDMVICYDNM